MGAILSISSPNNIFEWMAFLAEKYSSMFLQGTWITPVCICDRYDRRFHTWLYRRYCRRYQNYTKKIIRSKRELSNSSNLSVSYM